MLSALLVPLLSAIPVQSACKDSPALARLSGAGVETCKVRRFDAAELPVGEKDTDVQRVEGRIDWLRYLHAPRSSPQSLIDAYRAAIEKAGYQVVFEGGGGTERLLTAKREV